MLCCCGEACRGQGGDALYKKDLCICLPSLFILVARLILPRLIFVSAVLILIPIFVTVRRAPAVHVDIFLLVDVG
jgi:hypothetical protein